MNPTPDSNAYTTLDEQWQPKLEKLLSDSQEGLTAVGNTAVDENNPAAWLQSLDDVLQTNLDMIDTAARDHFGDHYDQYKAAYLITNNQA